MQGAGCGVQGVYRAQEVGVQSAGGGIQEVYGAQGVFYNGCACIRNQRKAMLNKVTAIHYTGHSYGAIEYNNML